MIEIIRKIVKTGIVTEKWKDSPTPARFRGELIADERSCNQCAACLGTCPTGAIAMLHKKLMIDQRACIFCGKCVASCPQSALRHTEKYELAELGDDQAVVLGDTLRLKIRKIFDRSLAIRHLDVGSCNACDWEMTALNNPVYDLQQYGIDFVASPRHADMLLVTGMVTRNLTQALQMTYEAVPDPKLVMAVGSCAAGGKTFGPSYAIRGPVDSLIPVDVYVPGCPPRPQALLYGLLLVLDRLS